MKQQKYVKKPWGYEIIWAQTSDYVGKLLFIGSSKRLSRQYHEIKEETIMVVSGTLMLEIGPANNIEEKILKVGESFHITPKLIHRFNAKFGDVEIMEVSTPHLEDVVRIEDDYNRIK